MYIILSLLLLPFQGITHQQQNNIATEPTNYTYFADSSLFKEDGLQGVVFLDPISLTKYLGHAPNFIEDNTPLAEMPHLPRLDIINSAKTQMVSLYQYHGNAVGEVSLIQVRYLKNTGPFPSKFEMLNIDQFVSSKGIHLGMSLSEVKAILGEPSEDGGQAMLYYIAYQQKGGLYYGNYYFENDKLVFFEFGEEYP